jgi:putative transposase
MHRGVARQAHRTHERWSMDLPMIQLSAGRSIRVLTLVDQFSRQTLLLEARFCFSGRDVVAARDRAIASSGTPVSITVDHGPEVTSRGLEYRAHLRGVKLDFIRRGRPTENGHIDSFNVKLRDEC